MSISCAGKKKYGFDFRHWARNVTNFYEFPGSPLLITYRIEFDTKKFVTMYNLYRTPPFMFYLIQSKTVLYIISGIF